MSGYPCEWKADSCDLSNRSGVGEFMVEGIKYRLSLQDFSDFNQIRIALDAAFASGMEAGKLQARSLMERAIKDLGVLP